MTSDGCTNGGAWRDSLNKIKEIGYCILSVMVLEDLRNKSNWVNTLVPVAYWISIIKTENFSFSFNFIMLFIGIVLAAIQFFIQDFLEGLYKKLFGKKEITIKQFTLVVQPIKQNIFIIFFGIAILVYGFVTFILMCMGEKNEIVWTLIAFYLIGNLYNIIFKTLHFLKNNLWQLFIIGSNWIKK